MLQDPFHHFQLCKHSNKTVFSSVMANPELCALSGALKPQGGWQSQELGITRQTPAWVPHLCPAPWCRCKHSSEQLKKLQGFISKRPKTGLNVALNLVFLSKGSFTQQVFTTMSALSLRRQSLGPTLVGQQQAAW